MSARDNSDKGVKDKNRLRRRRADAEQSKNAILSAAVQVLGERFDAGMEAVAEAAGVTRQTVYAHYPSREELLAAVVDHITVETVNALDDAQLDEGRAVDALLRLLEVSWRTFERYPVLLQAGAMPANTDEARRHVPVTERLTRLFRRGQRLGEFDRRLSPSWMVAVTIGLGHVAGGEVRAGRMTSKQAAAALSKSLLRMLGADEPHAT